MDTRDKIISDPGEARHSTWVTGYFDVLRPWHITALERIKSGGNKLTAVILPLPDALLPQRARAELAASLRVIDYVILAEDETAAALLQRIEPENLLRLEKDDLQRRNELIDHVHKRQIR